jgi:hypothetical protein
MDNQAPPVPRVKLGTQGFEVALSLSQFTSPRIILLRRPRLRSHVVR